MSDLASREIQPPRGPDAAALTPDQVQVLLNELGGNWEWVEGQRLEKEYKFPDFQTALDFSNRVTVGEFHAEVVLLNQVERADPVVGEADDRPKNHGAEHHAHDEPPAASSVQLRSVEAFPQ